MWGLTLVAVIFLWRNRKRHNSNLPIYIDGLAVTILIGTLRQFLAPQDAERVVAGNTKALLHTHRRHIACLFCDIRNFTALCEAVEPEDVITILQGFHDRVGGVVNTASRLCDAAADGQILIGRRAHLGAEDAIRAETLGKFELRGIAGPVETLSLLNGAPAGG